MIGREERGVFREIKLRNFKFPPRKDAYIPQAELLVPGVKDQKRMEVSGGLSALFALVGSILDQSLPVCDAFDRLINLLSGGFDGAGDGVRIEKSREQCSAIGDSSDRSCGKMGREA